ncbi:hypothetical protein DFP73DRAFT_563063 [Morchella snyderi]|nr:hypothetical protein DFP73DRAFT_563063 [Morchella snyderi]
MSSQASSPVTRRWDPTPGAGRPNGAASFPQTEYQVEKFHCKPCGISMHINDRETHIGGIKHGEAVASTSQGAPASQYSGASSSGGLPAPPPAQIPNYRCELCNMTMPLPDYHNHTYGKRHRTSVELANAQKQNDNAAPAVPTPPKVKVSLPKPGAAGKPSPRNIATEMVVTKVDGDLVVEVLKMEPDMRTGWCGICQEEVLRTTESHRSEAWKCDLCGITTHAAWKDLHMNTHDQRKPVSMFHRLGAYKML